MKNLLLFAVISISVILNSGCASKLMSFEKRKYNKGYHVDFAEKKNKKASTDHAAGTIVAHHNETKALLTATTETPSEQLSANYNNELAGEEITSVVSAEETKSEAAPQKKKAFQNPIFKNINSKKITVAAKHSIEKLMPKKNIAGTDQTMGTSFFTVLGAIIGGGCLIALGVMIFSNWASVTLMIIFLSGALLGLLLLIIGANS